MKQAQADLIREAITAAGFLSREAVHQLLRRELERIAQQANRGIKFLDEAPDPDLTRLIEHIGGIVREAHTSAVQLDMLGTLARNLPKPAPEVSDG